MSRYIKDYEEITILKVIKAYVVDGLSHRDIQRDILGVPAPDNGGGYIAMDILHHYGILGEHKSILAETNIEDIIDGYDGNFKKALLLLKEYFDSEDEASNKIDNRDYTFNEKTTEIKRETKVRINQDTLRKRVLGNYNHECAICSIKKDDLLVCSHIIPWSVDETNRLNPQNAICLCVLHDKLFDKLYYSLEEDYNIVLSQKSDDVIESLLKGLQFKLPMRELPDKKLLSYHMKQAHKL